MCAEENAYVVLRLDRWISWAGFGRFFLEHVPVRGTQAQIFRNLGLLSGVESGRAGVKR